MPQMQFSGFADCILDLNGYMPSVDSRRRDGGRDENDVSNSCTREGLPVSPSISNRVSAPCRLASGSCVLPRMVEVHIALLRPDEYAA